MEVLFTLLAVVIGAGIVWLLARRSRFQSTQVTYMHTSLEGMRAVGELSVFKAITKEIVTESDYSFGDFGRKYLRWAFSQKKLAMIFEFQIDFRYDLRSPQFSIETVETVGGRAAQLNLPPVKADITVRSLRFYDEQRSKLLPWLLPDLLNGAFGPGFSEADKNRLLDGAAAHARNHAMTLIEQLRPEVEASARATLLPLAHGLGVRNVQLAFNAGAPQIGAMKDLRALANISDGSGTNALPGPDNNSPTTP